MAAESPPIPPPMMRMERGVWWLSAVSGSSDLTEVFAIVKERGESDRQVIRRATAIM
jgi:hypothetical protein